MPRQDWLAAVSVYCQSRVLALAFLGFSAGLPFLLVFSTLSAWLRDGGIERTVIGFFSWVGVTYSIKVFWAPVIDRMPIPFLTDVFGKRRSWMLLAQLGIAAGLAGMAGADVHQDLTWIAYLAVFIAFCSATQDIVVDAFRIEAAETLLQGAMAASYVFGYRIALLAAGAGAFFIADFFDWSAAYMAMSLLMLVGVVTTLIIAEPHHQHVETAFRIGDGLESLLGEEQKRNPVQRFFGWLSYAVVSPFVEFFMRNGRAGLIILSLIAVYRLSDITMGVMTNPFYLDLGFSKTEIAEITKVFGFFMTLAGAALGGILVVRFGLMPPLLLGAVLVALTNLLFARMAVVEPQIGLLAFVISADNLSGGIATSVFIAYLSSLTNSAYTATQYALFSSLMTLPAKLLGGFSGLVVDQYGYELFFIYSSAIGLPAIVLTVVLMARQHKSTMGNHNQ